MKLAKPLVAAAVTGALGVGAWAALPAGATGSPSVQLTSSPAAFNATPSRCETQEWPDAATGQPAGLKAGGPAGFYLWHNDAGWHLEATHPTHDHMVFSGWFSSNGTIEYQRVDDEHNDIVKQGKGEHLLAFALNNYGGIDGVHFETHCADWLQFHLFIDGRPAGVERVYAGHGSTHPRAVPFTIDRGGLH